MAKSQAEIKASEIRAIQEKLQAIQVNRQFGRGSLPAMVEMSPNRATATATRPSDSANPSDSAKLAADVERLQHQYAAYLRQMQSAQLATPPSAQTPPVAQARRTQTLETPQAQSRRAAQVNSEERVAQALQRLERQAQRINELSAAQEAAMLEWKAIAEKLERDRKGVELEQDVLATGEDSRICEYLNTAVPYIQRDEDGLFVLTARSVDLFKAEREASAMAQTLRHRGQATRTQEGTSRQHRGQSTDFEAWARLAWNRVSKWVQAIATPKSNPSLKTRRSRQTQAQTEAIAVPSFSLQDAGMWVLGSVIVRVALDLFLVANPGMWFPVIALIAAPAAIAVYRATVAPQSGLVWGYRLFLIMVGLLLGGRL